MATITTPDIGEDLVGSLSGTPASGDTVIISGGAFTLTNADLSGTTLAEIRIAASSQNVFTAEPLKIKTTASGAFVNGGQGATVSVASTGMAGGTIFTVQNAPTGADPVLSLSACDVDTVYNVRGTLVASANADVANAYVYGGQARFEYGAGTPAITGTLVVTSGMAEVERDVATVSIHGGTVVIDAATCSPTTINLSGPNSVLKLQNSGTIGTLNGVAGVLDLTACSAQVTITTGNLHPGLTILRSSATIMPTYGTENNIGGGPKVRTV